LRLEKPTLLSANPSKTGSKIRYSHPRNQKDDP
jgi:hypothetical protein